MFALIIINDIKFLWLIVMKPFELFLL